MDSNIHPPRHHTSYKNESRPPNRFGSSSMNRVASPSYPYFLNQPTKSKFIGSFIHEYAFDSRAKQRPSKRARQRIRKRLAKLELEDTGSKTSPESGYDTTSGDCQTPGLPSPVKGKFGNGLIESEAIKNKRKDVTTSDSGSYNQQNASLPKENGEGDSTSHSRTTSVSSVGSLISDKTLRKLLKDLHRCEVSIVKYEAMLAEKCEDGQMQLREVFSNVRKYVNTRETDLRQELTTVQHNAATILERRKNTALYLKQAAEQYSSLEESQVAELKQQIKQFVTDRRVDEEVGTITRFHADPDDILPHIMGFGKVNRMSPQYTEWEENPEEAIEMSKHRLSFSISGLGGHRFSISSVSEVNSSPSHSITSDSADMHVDHTLFEPPPVDSPTTLEPTQEKHDEAKESPSHVLVTEKDTPALPQVAGSTKASVDDRTSTRRADQAISETKHEQRPDKKERSKVTRAAKVEATKMEESIEDVSLDKVGMAEGSEVNSQEVDKKITAAELILKQARVRESLKMQGVFLYNPITGEGPPPMPLPPATPTETTPSADHERSSSPTNRKKKTPTQLRRERKKRQRERERRQSELERISRENSAKSNSTCSSSSECKTPDILTAVEKNSVSEGEEHSPRKEEWSCVSTSVRDEQENDASGENSDNELTAQSEVTAAGVEVINADVEETAALVEAEAVADGVLLETVEEKAAGAEETAANVETSEEQTAVISQEDESSVPASALLLVHQESLPQTDISEMATPIHSTTLSDDTTAQDTESPAAEEPCAKTELDCPTASNQSQSNDSNATPSEHEEACTTTDLDSRPSDWNATPPAEDAEVLTPSLPCDAEQAAQSVPVPALKELATLATETLEQAHTNYQEQGNTAKQEQAHTNYQEQAHTNYQEQAHTNYQEQGNTAKQEQRYVNGQEQEEIEQQDALEVYVNLPSLPESRDTEPEAHNHSNTESKISHTTSEPLENGLKDETEEHRLTEKTATVESSSEVVTMVTMAREE